MSSVWLALISIFSKIFSWLPAVLAFIAGRRSKASEIELDNAKKQARYAEIEGRPKSDEDLIKSIEDGKF